MRAGNRDDRAASSVSALREWTPVRVYVEKGTATVEWLPFGNMPLTDPFFDRSVSRYRAEHPDVLPVRTSWDALGQVADQRPTLRPHGAIFHISRCGSTTISNALSAVDRHLVISEAWPINDLLRAHGYGHRREVQEERLRDLVAALGYQRFGCEEQYFIKFSSWNVLHLPFIRGIFPGLRWVFVYRNPIEVMVAVFNSSTGWMEALKKNPMAAAREFGFSVKELLRISREEYCARILAGFFEAALASYNADTLLLEHRQLRDRFLPDLLAFFGIEVTDAERARMSATGRFYSKDPTLSRAFADDSAEKQRAASPKLREMAERWVMPLYARIEDLRAGQSRRSCA